MAEVTFQAAIERAKAQVRAVVERRVRAYAGELLTSLVLNTPEDTGLARACWRVSTSPPVGVTVKGKHVPVNWGSSYAAGKATIAAWKPSTALYVYNNAAHIRKLNQGWSKQAPAGFIEAAQSRALSVSRNTK